MKDNTIGDSGPAQDPRIVEAIEACRPGSDDLSDPDLAFLATELAARAELDSAFERLQRVDGVLAEVFRNQPVPDGLEQRILARLEAARAERAEDDSADEVTPDEPAMPQPVAGGRRVSRRVLLSVAGATAVAASLLVAALLHWHAPTQYTGQDVLELAIDLFNTPSSDPWQTSSPPSAYPPSPKVVAVPDIRWRRVPSFLGCRAVAYDMSTPGGTQATLFVVKCPVAGLSTAPPLRPALMTGGRSTSAWQSGSLVYVLVVQGEARGYRRLLNVHRGPVA